jgi:hypothetical protein
MKLETECITASCLHALARMLDRLASMHQKMGGAAPDEPCLIALSLDLVGRPVARVKSGALAFRLMYERGEWSFA